MKQELLFAIHPVLIDLKINEDGTEIYWQNKKLAIKTCYPKNRGNYSYRHVQFKSRTHRVTKLICEAWHGMRDGDQHVQRYNGYENDHFKNLYWGSRGGHMKKLTKNAKRSGLSKINNNDIPEILKRIKNNETLISISISYNTSVMSIYRIKKRYYDPSL